MTAPTTLLPVDYDAPPVNPIGVGLFSAATLIDVSGPSRFLSSGVSIRPRNCATGWGTWAADPCAAPAQGALKSGDRPVAGEPFEPLVVWGYDECGPLEDFAEYEARALQNARLHEQGLAEAHFGARLAADATPTGTTDIVSAVAALEVALGEAGFYGTIHASARFAAYAAQANLIIRSSGSPILKTPLGHTWAFGAGYEDTLETTLVATGPVTVWRDPYVTRSTLDERHNIKAAIAERGLVIGYECLVAAVDTNPTP
ncbi:hypothetical protein MYP14_06050 [Rhodococcus pyridinivorans]|uniref:hypothetical protein n=1 Tax=Rhodococcus pyridinivorans TaxID=103816 RepID=UPI0020004C00|nr:hypothetical protein [Rhodococcus pyridinivorans]UPK64912.1 hypothetical protein MYP14_06050 [Rhodococcus pyridinivorans]